MGWQVPKNILSADIGGTHSRFALFSVPGNAQIRPDAISLVRKVRFPTEMLSGTYDLMQTLAKAQGEDGGFFTPASPEPVHIDAAVFGVPGPTGVADPEDRETGDEVVFCPNISWPFESRVVQNFFEGSTIRLINDFVANGFGCALLPSLLDLREVLPGKPQKDFSRAVVGAGTGLGHCLVLPGDPPKVSGSEGGHALLPIAGKEELALAQHILRRSKTEALTGDTGVAGKTLAYIYEYYTGKLLETHAIPELTDHCPLALSMIARFYGRAIRQYACYTLPLGGIYITGGLAANHPEIVTHPHFAAEVHDPRGMGRVLAAIPVWHVRNADVGLWGAAAYAACLLMRARVYV